MGTIEAILKRIRKPENSAHKIQSAPCLVHLTNDDVLKVESGQSIKEVFDSYITQIRCNATEEAKEFSAEMEYSEIKYHIKDTGGINRVCKNNQCEKKELIDWLRKVKHEGVGFVAVGTGSNKYLKFGKAAKAAHKEILAEAAQFKKALDEIKIKDVNPISNNNHISELETFSKKARIFVRISKEIDNQISISQSAMPKTKPLSSARMEMQKIVDDFNKRHEERMAILKNLNTNANLIPNHEGADRVKEIIDQESKDLAALLDAPFKIAMRDLDRIEQELSSPLRFVANGVKMAANDVKQWSTTQIQKIFPGKDQSNDVTSYPANSQEDQLENEPETTKLSF